MEQKDLRVPLCQVCGTADHLVIDVYRPPQRATRSVPAGRGRSVVHTVAEPGLAFFHCSNCGFEGGCSVPDRYRPPGWTG